MGSTSLGSASLEKVSRGTIPEELIRPQRGESPRYPVDTVIGPLGRGSVVEEAFSFSRRVAAALLEGNLESSSLSAMNKASLESLMSALEPVKPLSYRLGGGREESDGAISYLVRFIGREQAVTGELFVRIEETTNDEGAVRRRWVFEDLILESPKSRASEAEKPDARFDFPPYERFF